MYKFCHQCGKQLQPDSKFCSGCGTNLQSLSAQPPSAQPPTPPRRLPPMPARATVDSIGEDDDDTISVDRIDHLDIRQDQLFVEIVKPPTMKETVGGIVQMGISQGADKEPEFKRDMPFQNTTDDQIQKQFLKEGGTSRTNEKK